MNHEIEIDSDFDPKALTIGVGDTVMWTNIANSVHNANSVGTSRFKFGTGDLRKDESSNGITFSNVGTFDYHCCHHVAMSGSIIVT